MREDINFLRRIIRRLKPLWFGIRYVWQYQEIVESIYSPWFDITVGDDMLYMSRLEDLRCKFCGCKYVQYVPLDPSDLTPILFEKRQNHHENCLWRKIDRIQRV